VQKPDSERARFGKTSGDIKRWKYPVNWAGTEIPGDLIGCCVNVFTHTVFGHGWIEGGLLSVCLTLEEFSGSLAVISRHKAEMEIEVTNSTA
jgi:hypothetical protein